MTPNDRLNEMAAFLAKYGISETARRRPIKSRYYNLIIRKDGEIVETVEYVAANQIKSLKAFYHEQGFSVDAIEDVTVLENEKELVSETFGTNHIDPSIIKGVGGFGTPEATKSVIERDRNKQRARAAKRDGRPNGKTIRYTNSYSDPKSPLYRMYVRALRKNGFEVKNKVTGEVIFQGFQKETAEFVFDLITNQKINKSDLDIRFMGA